jgi:hypothetical protein
MGGRGDAGTEGRRDEGTKGRRHGGTKARRDEGTEGRRHGGTKARRHEGTEVRRYGGTEGQEQGTAELSHQHAVLNTQPRMRRWRGRVSQGIGAGRREGEAQGLAGTGDGRGRGAGEACDGHATGGAARAGLSHASAEVSRAQLRVRRGVGGGIYGRPCDECGAFRYSLGKEGTGMSLRQLRADPSTGSGRARSTGSGPAGMICPTWEGSAERRVLGCECGNEAPQDPGPSTQDQHSSVPAHGYIYYGIACMSRRRGHYGTFWDIARAQWFNASCPARRRVVLRRHDLGRAPSRIAPLNSRPTDTSSAGGRRNRSPADPRSR